MSDEKACNRCGVPQPHDQYRPVRRHGKVWPRVVCRSCENVERQDQKLRRKGPNDDAPTNLRAAFGLEREDWMVRAACRGIDTARYFPTQGEPSQRLIRETCDVCPVREECLAYAKRTHSVGIWGGMGVQRRKRLKAVSS